MFRDKHKSKIKIRLQGTATFDIMSKSVDNFMWLLWTTEIYGSIKDNDKYLVNTDDNGYCYISNHDCSVCGYNEKWMIECRNCKF